VRLQRPIHQPADITTKRSAAQAHGDRRTENAARRGRASGPQHVRQEIVHRERGTGRLTGELPLKTSLAGRAGRLIRHRQQLTAEPHGRFAQLISVPPFHRCSLGMPLKAAAAAWSMLVGVVLVMRLANRRVNRRDRSLHRPHNVPMPVGGVSVVGVPVRWMLVPAAARVAPMAVARTVPATIVLTWAVLIRMTTGMTVLAGMAVRHRKSSGEQLGRNSHNRSKLPAADEEQTHTSTVANAPSPGNVTPAPT